MTKPPTIPEVDVPAARQLLAEDTATFVDVRDPASYRRSHIPGALLVNDAQVKDFIETTDKARTLVVVCFHGHSSLGGAAYFLDHGFQKVFSLRGGMAAWQHERAPQTDST